jgi:hypothetical protein
MGPRVADQGAEGVEVVAAEAADQRAQFSSHDLYDNIRTTTNRGKSMQATATNTNSNATQTARETLGRLADLARDSLNPRERADKAAATLREVGDLAGDLPLTYDDARDGFAVLGMDRVGDSGPVSSRRRTCEELAALLSHNYTSTGAGEPRRLAAVYSVVAGLYVGSPDGRRNAMAAIAAREVLELAGTTTVVAERPEPTAVVVGTGDAKDMPPGLAESLVRD